MVVIYHNLLCFLDNNTLEHFVYYIFIFTVNTFRHIKTDTIEARKQLRIKNNRSLYCRISVIKRIFIPRILSCHPL